MRVRASPPLVTVSLIVIRTYRKGLSKPHATPDACLTQFCHLGLFFSSSPSDNFQPHPKFHLFNPSSVQTTSPTSLHF